MTEETELKGLKAIREANEDNCTNCNMNNSPKTCTAFERDGIDIYPHYHGVSVSVFDKDKKEHRVLLNKEDVEALICVLQNITNPKQEGE